MSHFLEVQGEKIVASGLCLSRNADGEIVFVEGLLPGEHASVEVTKAKGKTRFGGIHDLNTRSKDRIDPKCPHFLQGCGGCDFQHISVDAQHKLKREIVVDALVRIAKLTNADDIVSKTFELPVENYRTTARVLVNSKGWGFRARNSHEMVPISSCMVLDDRCQKTASDFVEDLSVLQELDKNGKENLYEIQVRSHPEPIFDTEISVSEKSFYQSHRNAQQVLTDLLLKVVEDYQPSGVFVDLYSGVGLFGLALAKTGRKVVCVEGNHHAIGDARKNLEGLDAEIVHSDVKKFVYDSNKYGDNCDLVIADPSRDGITKDGLSAVLSCEAKTVVLISCDPASGARDISLLRDNGYELKSCIPIDMFGYTHHVEIFSVLELVL